VAGDGPVAEAGVGGIDDCDGTSEYDEKWLILL